MARKWNIRGIDHIGIAVKNLDEAVETFKRKFGLERVKIVNVEDQGLKAGLLETGNAFLELMEPMDANGTVARFLSKSGGRNSLLHHIAFALDADLEDVAQDLKALGVEMVYPKPRRGVKGRPVNFCYPRGTSDILVELVYCVP